MFARLWKALRHPISQNVIALYGLQFATFIVPMVTLPYVARVLRPSAFGLVVFAQSFSFVLVVFIDWGFTNWGIRAAAETRDHPERLSDVVHRVRSAQLMLAAVSLPLTAATLLFIPKLDRHPEFLLMAWIAAFASGLSPSWFFLGTEKMRLLTAIQLGFRAAGAALTFVLVKSPGDAWIVMALFTASAVAGWLVSDAMMYRQVHFRRPALRPALSEVRGSTNIFIGTVAATLYSSFNVVLLGFFEPSASVAHFGAAERVVRISLTVLGPIGMAVYPRITSLQAAQQRDRARRLLMIAVAAAAGPALVVAGGLMLFAPLIIRVIYGHRFVHASVPILRVLALIIPIGVTGVICGTWLLTLHRDRRVAMIVLAAGILNVILGCILTLLFGPIGMAWSVIAAETTAALGGIFTILQMRRHPEVEVEVEPSGDALVHLPGEVVSPADGWPVVE